jgi:hypothetical protein
LPKRPTATHSELDPQDTDANGVEASATVRQVGYAAVGSLEIEAVPCSSTATQSEVVGQETPVMP